MCAAWGVTYSVHQNSDLSSKFDTKNSFVAQTLSRHCRRRPNEIRWVWNFPIPSVPLQNLQHLNGSAMVGLNEPLSSHYTTSQSTAIDSTQFSNYLDSLDSLSHLRANFHVPLNAVVILPGSTSMTSQELSQECIYLAGNSLGLMPKNTSKYIAEELGVWATRWVTLVSRLKEILTY